MPKYVLNDNPSIKIKREKKSIKVDFISSLTIPYLLILVILVILPMLIILLRSFTLESSSALISRYSFSNFIFFFSEASFIKVLVYSIFTALITTFFTLIIGYPVAYIISKFKAKRANLILTMITAPMWINMLLRTFAWKMLLDDQGIINTILKALTGRTYRILGTDVAIIIGMVYIFLPFMILPIHTILAKMDKDLIEASKDLGGNSLITFIKIIIPLSLPGVLSGVIMVLLPASTTLVIPKYLGENKYNIGTLIEDKFLSGGEWGLGSAISIILALVIMVFVFLINKTDRSVENKK